jgi:universal stress protein A
VTTRSGSSARPFTVVAAVDFSPSSDRALATARTLCNLSGGGRLYAVHVVSLMELSAEMAASPLICSEIEAAQISAARLRLAACVSLEGLTTGSELILHVQTGVAHEVIVEVARNCGADLIVVGTRGLRGIRRIIASSSVSERVTRDAPCSVTTVRSREVTAAERTEAACQECTAATTANGGVYTRCAQHHRRELRAHTYADLGDAMRGPTNAFSL